MAYGDYIVMKNLDFSIKKGEIFFIIGGSGCGKSTLLRVMAGLLPINRGMRHLDGKDYERYSRRLFSQRVTYLPQDRNLSLPYTAGEIVLFGAYARHGLWETLGESEQRRARAALKQVGAAALFDRPVTELSGGERQRITIARAMLKKASVIILDEATAGLDPIVRDEVLDLLLDFVQDERHGVLVSSHITSDLEKVADYITFLHQGKLVFTLEKDLLVDQYGVLHCGAAVFDTLDPADILAWRREAYQYKVLVRDRYQAEKKYPQALVSPAAIEDTMLFYVKGEVS